MRNSADGSPYRDDPIKAEVRKNHDYDHKKRSKYNNILTKKKMTNSVDALGSQDFKPINQKNYFGSLAPILYG